MKGKSWLKYLILAVLLVAAIFLRSYVEKRLQTYFSEEYKVFFGLLAVGALINIGIGLLLGGEHLLSEIRKTGKWKINVPKFILIGLPSLFATLSFLGIYLNNPFINKIIHIIPHSIKYFLISNSENMLLFQVILGYIVMTSFYKCNKND